MKPITLKFTGNETTKEAYQIHLKEMWETTMMMVKNASQSELQNHARMLKNAIAIIENAAFEKKYPNLANQDKDDKPKNKFNEKKAWTIVNGDVVYEDEMK